MHIAEFFKIRIIAAKLKRNLKILKPIRGPDGFELGKTTGGRKSRDTLPLKQVTQKRRRISQWFYKKTKRQFLHVVPANSFKKGTLK